MIIKEPMHEECENCTHIAEIPIREGPQTFAEYKKEQLFIDLYTPFLRSMIDDSTKFMRLKHGE